MKVNFFGNNFFLNRRKFFVELFWYNGFVLEVLWIRVGYGIVCFIYEFVLCGFKVNVICCRGGVGLVDRMIFCFKNFVFVVFWEEIEL